MKTGTSYPTIRRLALVAGVLGTLGLQSACGGKQTTVTIIDGVEVVEERGRRGRDREATPERQLTEEELAAQREQQLDALRAQAAELYRSASGERRDYRRIRGVLDDILRLNPGDPDATFNQGVLLYDQGDVDGAIAKWREAGSLDETYARGLANIGYVQLSQGDLRGAEATFAQCLERRPIEPGCNMNMAYLALQRGMEDGRLTVDEAQVAIDALRFALAGEPRNPQAYADLARLYFETGRLQLAKLVVVNALQQQIDSPALRNRFGLIALEEGNVVEAYRQFTAAVQQDAEYVEAQMNIGAMALSFRDYATSRTAFEAALAHSAQLTDEQRLEARLSYGVSLRGLDDLAGAQREYEAILASRPGDLRALYNLGVLYQEGHRNYERAVEYFQQYEAANRDPSTALARDVANRVRNLTDLIELLREDF